MKKSLFTFLLFAAVCINSFGDGIKTKLCQSASSVRNPSQGATTEIHSVYFNPAGTVFLKEGIHFSISNQTIFQKGYIKTDMTGLNINEFSQKQTIPVFPSIYAVYKHKKLAFSLGFYPVDRIGKTIYNDGLALFEMQIGNVVKGVNAFYDKSTPVTKYSYDSQFEETSRFLGFQGTVAYKVSEKLALSAGIRYVAANNIHYGDMKGVKMNFGGGTNMVDADQHFTQIATDATDAATSVQELISSGAGNFTLAQVQSAGYISSAQASMLQSGLSHCYNSAQIASMNMIQINDAYLLIASNMSQFAQLTSDIQVDVLKSGSGIAPIFGVTFKPTEKLVIGLKYELKTKMKLKNERYKDNGGLFSNTIIRNDTPSMLTMGISYKVIHKLSLSGTTIFYFDKSADYGKKIKNAFVENSRVIDKNMFELALGTEFSLSEKLLFSIGYVFSKSGVNAKFQDELDFHLTSNSLCGGIKYNFSEKTSLNLGFMNTWYQLAERQYTNPTYKMTFDQKKFIIALGVDIMI